MTETLFLSKNTKVNMGGGANSFGTLPGSENGGTCPGATHGEGGCCSTPNGRTTQLCYVNKLMRIYRNVEPRLRENTNKIVGKSYEEKLELFNNTIEEFKSNNTKDKWFFRCYWSGDMEDESTAMALVAMAKQQPEVMFWAYTRTYWFAHHFKGLKNYALYLSIDPVNKAKVLETYETLKEYKNIGLAWMDNKSLYKPADVKFIHCPSTAGAKLPNGENRHCKDCKLCMRFDDDIKLRNISFSIH